MTDPLPPIVREVEVPAPPDLAFRVFTDGIGRWWPLATHGVFGGASTVSFRDGGLVEVAHAGQESVWGTVTEWRPPESVAFTWHPAGTTERATDVRVTFVPTGDGRTLVRLEHAGWERLAEPGATRDEYGNGWPTVLGRYADLVGSGSAAR